MKRWVKLPKVKNKKKEKKKRKEEKKSSPLKVIRGRPATWNEETMIDLKRLGAILGVSPEGSLMA
jgi:hypothetical protein